MFTSLKLLLVDECPEDAEALVRALQQDGSHIDCRQVDSVVSLRAALLTRWDVVVSERVLGDFDGVRVRELVQQHDPKVPFVFLCRTLGEEWVVDAMRAGARYCLSKANLEKLPAVLAREIEEAERSRNESPEVGVLEAVARACGVVAHDFNNLLTVIRGYAGLLLEALPPGDGAARDLASIHQAAAAAEQLTGKLLLFSRPWSRNPEVLSINDSLRRRQAPLQQVIGDHAVLHLSLGQGLWPVMMDPAHLEQVVTNLVQNGRDAMPPHGENAAELVIATANVPGGGRGEDAVSLTVRDTGHGMDAAVRQQAFEPFYTTRHRGRGAGLGLSVVYRLISQAGGRISLDSEPGRGTTVRILLPRHR